MAARRTALALALVAALAAVLGLYYYAHKPLTPAQALAFAQSFANLAVALLLLAAAVALGRRLMRLWLDEPLDFDTPRPMLELALGWGALALIMLLLGALHLFYPIVAWLVVAALLLWLRRDLRAWLSAAREMLRALVPSGRLDRLAAGFSLLVLALGLLRALSPPATWDALVYHLTLPELYSRAHSLQVNTADFNLFSGMPQLNEMLYTAAALLRIDPAAGAITAQLLGLFFGLALCLALAAIACDLGLPAWLAPAILLSSLSIALELAWAYADLLLMLLALAMLLALRQWSRQPPASQPATRRLILAGVFAGLACGCKYTGVIVPLAGGAIVLAFELTTSSPAGPARLVAALRSSLAFVLPAAVVFAPWLIKNWLLTGSPVYPLLWPAADMDALRQWFYNRPDLAEPLWRALLIFPRATFFGVQGANDLDATLGPLLLLCAGLLIFVWRVLSPVLRRELSLWLLFAAVAYGGWVLLAAYSALGHQARLFFAVLPALALLGAAALAGVGRLNQPTLRLSRVVNAAVVLVLALSAVELVTTFVSQNPLPYLSGTQTAADYTTAQLGWYAPALDRVNSLPAGSRVVFLWEARSFACAPQVQCVPDVVIDRWWHARRTTGVAEQILAQWRSEGATHVLLYDLGARFTAAAPNNAYATADWTELDHLRAALRPVATFGDAYTLYALP